MQRTSQYSPSPSRPNPWYTADPHGTHHSLIQADERELLSIAGDASRVFLMPDSLDRFEQELFKYVGVGCPGVDLGKDPSE